MTTVVAATCPWMGSETVAGLTFVADCRLSVEVAPGVFKVYSDEARKLFKLSQFVMAAYCGSRYSARFALARLRQALPKATPLSSSTAIEPHLRSALRKGAAEARQRAGGEARLTGPFSVFVAYLDEAGRFGILIHHETGGGSAGPYAAIVDEKGAKRLLVMGSGMVAASEYRDALLRISTEIGPGQHVKDLPFKKQAGILGLALLDLLELKKVPLSGGGLQAMSLTTEGVEAWELWSSSSEYLTDSTAEPDWKRHGPKNLGE